MTTQLDLYNDALLICGERFLASLTENREPRRLLDQVWSSGGVRTCLEAGQWYFAMRTQQIDYDSTIEPAFGYRRAFVKPDDWVITSALSAGEYFRPPLTRYVDEAGYWYADEDTIYVRFVSDDVAYGNNLLKWPEAFREFVAAHFASKIVHKLQTSEEERTRVREIRKRLLREAKGNSLMAGPTQFPAQGSWSMARQRYGGQRDGGNNSSGNLIG